MTATRETRREGVPMSGSDMGTTSQFGLKLKSILDRLDLGTSISAWLAKNLPLDPREHGRWLNERVLPKEESWQALATSLRANFPGVTWLKSELEELKSILVSGRRIPRYLRGAPHAAPSLGLGCQVRGDHEREVEITEGDSNLDGNARRRISKPIEIREAPESQRLWNELTSMELHRALDDREWAWAAEPFSDGRAVKDIVLVYHETRSRYDRTLHPLARKALEKWCQDPRNAERAKSLVREPWGKQVRITRAGFNHSNHSYEIHLEPSKFLYYMAIQRRLGDPPLRRLRRAVFENALLGLDREEPLLLPSTFSIHMAVVSSDGMGLLRQRSNLTPLYRGAWEAGVGEFMHGPRRTRFRHFTPSGRPSLSLFLRNAVAEELNYRKARTTDFRIYGIAAERQTLAPKLIVVYTSDATIDKLKRGALEAKDNSPAVTAIPLTVESVASAIIDPKYPDWGPTSKLALSLALIQRTGSSDLMGQLEREIRRLRSMRK